MDLTEFLRARLDEDEQAARAATAGPWEWQADKDPAEWGDDGPNLVSTSITWMDSGGGGPHPTQVLSAWGHDAWGISAEDADLAHIVRHDPARVLREVAAKRAILAQHVSVVPDYGPDKGQSCCGRCGAVADDAYMAITWPCDTLRALAAVYSGHPDYRQEWKP